MPTPNDLTDAEINQHLAELLGTDLTANTDEDRLPVLRAFTAQNIEIIAPCYREYQHNLPVQDDGFKDIGLSMHWFVWDYREGQPWQTDLEAHVAAYRRMPPNWAGSLELAFELGGEMRKRYLELAYQEALWETIAPDEHYEGGCKQWCWEMISTDPAKSYWPGFMMAHATPRQRALAALSTLEEAKDAR